MNIVDKNLLLNKIKDMSVQNNILNKIKSDTIKSSYIMDSIIESPSQSNVKSLIQSLQIPEVPRELQKQQIPEVPRELQKQQIPEVQQKNLSNITNTFPFEIIESTDINPIIETIEDINEPIDIIAIIESIKEPIALLEKYMLTNHVPSNLNSNDIKDYINIYKTIIAVKEDEDFIKMSKYAEKSGCFSYIKKIFFK